MLNNHYGDTLKKYSLTSLPWSWWFTDLSLGMLENLNYYLGHSVKTYFRLRIFGIWTITFLVDSFRIELWVFGFLFYDMNKFYDYDDEVRDMDGILSMISDEVVINDYIDGLSGGISILITFFWFIPDNSIPLNAIWRSSSSSGLFTSLQ